MSLGHGKRLLGDRYGTSGAYHPALTARLRALQHVTVVVGNNDAGVRDVVSDTGNDGVGVRDIMTNDGNGSIWIRCKFLLEPES